MSKWAHEIWMFLKQFPEYIPAVFAAGTVLMMAVPIYLALWYFLSRRKMLFPWRLQFAVLGVFVMFVGLAFAFGSPFATNVHSLLRAYLFVTCLIAAYCVVALFDIFFIRYYLVVRRKVYVSPPLQKVINLAVFCVAILPILHYVLRFNPLTLIAIPTIATAGVALALQDTLKAFIAGIGLGHVIRIGDWIGFQDREGRVVDINWSRVVLRSLDGDLVLIPNTILQAQTFINYSTNRSHRMTLKIGVSYTVSPEKVKAVIRSCAEDANLVLVQPAPKAAVFATGESAIVYALYYWIEDYGQRLEVQDSIATRLWEAFKKEGFEIPFPFPTFTLAEGFHPITRQDVRSPREARAATKNG